MPINLALYKQAMRHSSIASTNERGIKNSYERLEYLGDAILGMMVAEYLYTKFPFKDEGFLTKIRAKIVNHESLNCLGQKIGLKELVQHNRVSRVHHSIYGDCLEALIGALYLDYEFQSCKNFVIKKLINPHYDFDELISRTTNFKSHLLEWSQKENKNLSFEIINEKNRKFTAQVFLNDSPIEVGYGLSKKKAEQDAAEKTYNLLKLDE